MISKLRATSRSAAMSRVLRANVVVGVLAAGLLAVPAFGQPASQIKTPAASSGGIEEVVVTARRVQESLQRVPVAVTAVSAEVLAQKGVNNLEQLSRAVPGFFVSPSTQTGMPLYTIRGLRGDSNPTVNTEPAVALYFAEVNQARSQGSTGAFFDLESVQVLKGPQGTLFGRNSTGGAVLITPKAPQDTFGGYVQGSYGNFDYRDFEAVLNIPFDDKVALRASGKITKRDGYITNIVTGRAGPEIDGVSGRISLLLKPTDSIRSMFIATHLNGKTEGNFFRLYVADPSVFQSLFGAPFPGGFGPGLAAAIGSLYQADAAFQNSLPAYSLASNIDVFSHDRVSSIQNTTEIELNDHLTLKNIVGYKTTGQNQQSDFSGGLTEMFFEGLNTHAKLFSEEIQLQGKINNLQFVVGGYLSHEEADLQAETRVFGEILKLGIPGLEFVFPARNFPHNQYVVSSYSGFGHLNYDLSHFVDGLSVSGGVRLTYDVKKANFGGYSASGIVPGIAGYLCELTLSVTPVPDDAHCHTLGRITSTELTYDVSMNYQATEDVLVYVAHRHGYKAGGFDIIPPSLAVLSYKPEFVDDIELGVKSDFQIGAMPGRLNTAAYYDIYKDIQRLVAVASLSGGVANATVNVAKAHIYGAEVELTLKPTPALDVTATYAYTVPQNETWLDTYTLHSGAKEILDISDSPFNFVPTQQWSVTTRYTLPVPEQYGELALSAIWYGQSGQYAGDNNTENCGSDGLYAPCRNRQAKIQNYNLLNLRADWKNVGGAGFDLGLFANNVLNRTYLNSIMSNIGALGVGAQTWGPPRMYGVVLKVPFGGEAG